MSKAGNGSSKSKNANDSSVKTNAGRSNYSNAKGLRGALLSSV